MYHNKIVFIFLSVISFFSVNTYAVTLEVGQSYELNGFFTAFHTDSNFTGQYNLATENSYFTMNADGTMDFQFAGAKINGAELGKLVGKVSYDLGSLNNQDADIYMNFVDNSASFGAYKQVGSFFPQGFPGDSVAVGIGMPGLLQAHNNTWHLWVRYFDQSTGADIGGIDFHLGIGEKFTPAGSTVPEPMSVILLSSGLLGVLKRRCFRMRD